MCCILVSSLKLPTLPREGDRHLITGREGREGMEGEGGKGGEGRKGRGGKGGECTWTE